MFLLGISFLTVLMLPHASPLSRDASCIFSPADYSSDDLSEGLHVPVDYLVTGDVGVAGVAWGGSMTTSQCSKSHTSGIVSSGARLLQFEVEFTGCVANLRGRGRDKRRREEGPLGGERAEEARGGGREG